MTNDDIEIVNKFTVFLDILLETKRSDIVDVDRILERNLRSSGRDIPHSPCKDWEAPTRDGVR